MKITPPSDPARCSIHPVWQYFLKPFLLATASLLLLVSTSLSSQAAIASETPVIVYNDNCVSITSPTNIVIYSCERTALPPKNYDITVANRCTDVQAVVRCDPDPASPLSVGTTTVNCVLVLNGKITDRWQIQVLVILDKEPPRIKCPESFTIFACEGPNGCSTVVDFPPPIAVDNSGAVAVVCNPPSGSVLACGDHVVTCTAFDRCGNKSTCEFVISVRAVPPVSIKCPTSQTLRVPCGKDCVPVEYPAPFVVNGAIESCTPAPGTCLKPGQYVVTCVATNACSRDVCRFVLNVLESDSTPPEIRCPQDIVVELPCNKECVEVRYPEPAVINGKLAFCNPPSGSCLPVGVHIIECFATNDCARTKCTFTVTVKAPPQVSIVCPRDPIVLTVPCGKDCVELKYPAPTILNGSLESCTPAPGTCLPPGQHLITCVATNACSKDVCRFFITVKESDATPPEIRCPQDIVIDLPCNKDCVEVRYPEPGVINGKLAFCNPPSGTCLKAGVHIIECFATNDCARAKCTFTITVRPSQGEPPIIRCPQDIVVELPCNKDCIEVKYPAPVVLNGTLAGCIPAPGTCLKPGVHIIECFATNDCSRAKCTFTITVRPVPPIEIKCPDDIVIRTCGQGEIVRYPRPLLPEGVDADRFRMVCDPPSGSFFPIGTNKVVCCIFDDRCDRRVCCEFNVVVVPGTSCVKAPLNMVLWLPFDEAAGVIANNIVGGAPNGFHMNGPAPLFGQKVLNSLIFDGVNDYVAVPNYAAIQLAQSDLTIDAWVIRREEAGRRVIVSKMGPNAAGAPAFGYEFYLNNGVMNLDLGGGAISTFNSGIVVPNDNKWHHVAVSVDRSGAGLVRFYLNGAMVSPVAGPIPAPLANNSRLHVGASTFPGPQNFWRGAIDEVEIFNRVVPGEQIRDLYLADVAGKCKIKCTIPWDISFPPNSNYVTIHATVRNCTPFPQPITWAATGPMPIPVPAGVIVVPALGSTVIPIQICRPTNDVPVGSVVEWNLHLQPLRQCPIECMGSVINPGPLTVDIPQDVVDVPGTRPGTVRVNLNGLPPGLPLRFVAIGPDMEPDLNVISINGLPPGKPWDLPRPASPAADPESIQVPVRFVIQDPIGIYTILVQADLNGDGKLDTFASFDIGNPVVPPPLLSITQGAKGFELNWNDEGDGILESATSINGPWKQVQGARPVYLVPQGSPEQYFRVVVPDAAQ